MIRILFVCHGNICRSVGAQYIMQDLVNKAGCSDDFYIDSAATSTGQGSSKGKTMKNMICSLAWMKKTSF